LSPLLDALLGLGDFKREGAPEPSLLPWLTRFASPSRLLFAARQAELCVIDNRVAVPAVGRATATVIARRAGKVDSRSLYQAAVSLPLIGQLATLQPVAGAGAELTARIGARLGDAAVVERAIASAFGVSEVVLARAAGLSLVGNASELLQVTLDDLPSVSVWALSAAAARLDSESSARLLRSWLSTGREPATIVVGIVEILPRLSDDVRERAAESALEHIGAGALQSTAPWIVSYLVRRIRETNRGARASELQALAESLSPPWREVVAREGRLEHVDDEAALRSSHPYSAQIFGPLLRAEADRPLGRMIDLWGGTRKEAEYRSGEETPKELYLNALITELHDTVEIPRIDAFARGQKYRVAVRLAAREVLSGVIADVPAPLDLAVPHDLYISLFASWLPATPPQPIVVAGPGALRSTAATVEFTVPPGLDRVELTVVLMERIGDKVVPIQSGVIAGDVIESGSLGAGISMRIDSHPSRPPEPATDGVTIMMGDDTLVVYGPAAPDGRFRDPGQLSKLRAELGDQVLQHWAAVGEAKEKKTLAGSLVQLAASGSRVLELLKKRLVADAETRRRLFDTDETVRLWSRDLGTDLPVEFIYDGGVPDYKHPSLCDQFFEGLRDGACRKCENRGGSICAFDFWAFRRRIERRVMDDVDASSGNSISKRPATTFLSMATPAAFGASVNVKAASREAIITLLKEGTAGSEPPAKDWETWQALLKQRPHPLLVLLSHTEQGKALEIEGDLVDRQWITEDYVNPHGQQPGPLVLLTGCETARPEFSFLSFVSRFLDKGASVVVGTLALIREDASAEATLQLLCALRDVVSRDTTNSNRAVGEVMRRTRCRLLANSDLTGLNLVAYGDADWRFDQGGGQE